MQTGLGRVMYGLRILQVPERLPGLCYPAPDIAFALVLVYAGGLLLSLRLSQRIVAVIDGLSHAAIRVGKGDFSARVPVPEQDQLGMLAKSFNEMTRDLESLREQEKQTAVS